MAGAVLSPFDCWLILRGLQTLVPRMRLHCENARQVAEFLSTHPAVSVVHYPGLASDPGHAIASRQMRDFGGMLSFEVRGGREEAFAFTSRLKLIVRATSLGGTHSLIEHRASIEGVFSRSPESLLRLSVGPGRRGGSYRRPGSGAPRVARWLSAYRCSRMVEDSR